MFASLPKIGAYVVIVLASLVPLGIGVLFVAQHERSKFEMLHMQVAEFVVSRFDETIDEVQIAAVGLDGLISADTAPQERGALFEETTKTDARCTPSIRAKLDDFVLISKYLQELRLIRPDRGVICGTANRTWKLIGSAVYMGSKNTMMYSAIASPYEQTAIVFHIVLDPQTIVEAVVPIDRRKYEGLSAPLSSILDVEMVERDGRSLLTEAKAGVFLKNYGQIAAKSDSKSLILASARYPFAIKVRMNTDALQRFLSPLTWFALVLSALMSACAGFIFIKKYQEILVEDEANMLSAASSELHQAIDREEFIPFYQPIINLRTGHLVGCEVLMRWRRPNGLVLQPSAFMDELEDPILARKVTQFIMRKALEECGDMLQARPHLYIAFNLFASQFVDTHIVTDLKSIFTDSKIALYQIMLEITEHKPLPDLAKASKIVGDIQALGCTVALDDLGIGCSNLITLQALGVNQIKIDKHFIDTIRKAEVSSPIVDGLIHIANALELGIVAEGIETRDQVQNLLSRGVTSGQGYVFSKPLGAAEFMKLLHEMEKAEALEVQS